MPISPRKVRIGGAALLAVLMVAGAYVLPGWNLPKTKAVNAELTDDLLASYVSKDTDQDGLPDWQEALYGTDPAVADTDGDGINDGEAVRRGMLTPNALASELPSDPLGEDDLPGRAPAAGSITERFARMFFTRVMEESNGQPMSAEAQEALTTQLLGEFTNIAARELTSPHTMLSVRTSPSTGTLEYAAAVESILKRNEVSEGNGDPAVLMQARIDKGDESARTKLTALAGAYASITTQLQGTQVPPALANEHLQLLRSFDTLARSTRLVSQYENDPLGVLGALSLYAPSSRDIVAALTSMATVIVSSGDPAPGSPGAYIVSAARYAQSL